VGGVGGVAGAHIVWDTFCGRGWRGCGCTYSMGYILWEGLAGLRVHI